MAKPDSALDRLPAFIDCIVGMPIMVTNNICKQDGIVNGSVAKLHSVTFPEKTQFTTFHDDDIDTTVLIPNQQAEFVIIELENPIHSPLPGLAPNLYALRPMRKTGIAFKPRPNDNPIRFAMDQFPIEQRQSASIKFKAIH
jgi:hypothetical protein